MPIHVIARRLLIGGIVLALLYFWLEPTGQELFTNPRRGDMRCGLAAGRMLYPFFFWIWTGAAGCFWLRWVLGARHSPSLFAPSLPPPRFARARKVSRESWPKRLSRKSSRRGAQD